MIKNILKKTQVLFFVVMSSLYLSDLSFSSGDKKGPTPDGGSSTNSATIKKLATDFVKLAFDNKSEVEKSDFQLVFKIGYSHYATFKALFAPNAPKPKAEEPKKYILDYYKAFNAEPVKEEAKTPAATTNTTEVKAEVSGALKAGATVTTTTTGGAAAGTQVKPEDALAQLLEGIWDETVDVGKDTFGAKIKDWLGKKDFTDGLAKMAVDATGETDAAKKKTIFQAVLKAITVMFDTEWKADTSFKLTFKVNLTGLLTLPGDVDEIHKKTSANFLTISTSDLGTITLLDLQRMGYHLVKFTFGKDAKMEDPNAEDKKDPLKALLPMANKKNAAAYIKLIIDDAVKQDGKLSKLEAPAEGSIGKEAKGKFTIAKVDADAAIKNGLVLATEFDVSGTIKYEADDAKAYPTVLKATPYLEWTMGADHYVLFEREVDAAVKTFALNYDKIAEKSVNAATDFKHAKYQFLIKTEMGAGTGGLTPCPVAQYAVFGGQLAKALDVPAGEDGAVEFLAKAASGNICLSKNEVTGMMPETAVGASALGLTGVNFAVFKDDPVMDGPTGDAMRMLVAKGFFQFAYQIYTMTKDPKTTEMMTATYKEKNIMKFIKSITTDVKSTLKIGTNDSNLLEVMGMAKAFTMFSPPAVATASATNVNNMFGTFDGDKGMKVVMSYGAAANQFDVMTGIAASTAPGGTTTGGVHMITGMAGSTADDIFVDFGTKGVAAEFSLKNIIFYKKQF